MSAKGKNPRITLKKIPIDLIDEPRAELRSVIVKEELEELAKSMHEIGLIEPVVVRKKDDRYELIAGLRRYLAAQMIDLQEIEAKIIEVSDKQADIMRVTENEQRSDVAPLDRAAFYNYLKEKHGMSIEEIAKSVGKSQTWIYRTLALLELDPVLREALRGEVISPRQALELQKFPTPSDRKYFLHLAVKHGATVDTIRAWRANYAKSKPQPIIETPPEEITTTTTEEEIHYEPPKRTCELCQEEVPLLSVRVMTICDRCWDTIQNLILQAAEASEKKEEE